MHPAPAELRLFVALWPNAEIAMRIAQSAMPTVGDGRAVPAERLHLTLVFIGRLGAERLDDCRAALASVRAESFKMYLERYGLWRRNGICWLAPRKPEPACMELVAAVVEALKHAAIPFDRRRFRPHLTVARKCRNAGSMDQPVSIGWTVSRFRLVQSTLDSAGSVYCARGEWPLRRLAT
jgi:2'-5' RNA ligase